jgi:hypothetical protein
MDAYDKLTEQKNITALDEQQFNKLIKDFQTEYLTTINYGERIRLHRQPGNLRNELLEGIYKYLNVIQQREEMRYQTEKTSGHVPTVIVEIWQSDHTLRSCYNAIKKYCAQTSTDFTTIAVHMAEYKAMLRLAHMLQRANRLKKPAVSPAKSQIHINSANTAINNPKVFIHYSWDNEPHKAWVLALVNKLVYDGVDVLFDRYELGIGSNNTHFMEKIAHTDKVVMIMTEGYRQKADNRTGGIGYEYQIISNEMNKDQTHNHKFLPVLRQGLRENSIPIFLQSFLALPMVNDLTFEQDYIELLRNIYDDPAIKKPPLGKKPNFEQTTGVSQTPKPEISLFDLDFTHEAVHDLLGPPQLTSGLIETYWSHGLVIFYNRHWDKVDGILAKQVESGIAYQEPILGIKVGDSFAEVKTKIGNPLYWGLPDDFTSFALYHINGRYLGVSIWRANPEDNAANFKFGSVFSIAYCAEHSILACEPIVVVAIEEIKAGKIPSHIESEHSIDAINLNALYFQEPYIALPTQIGPYGGYLVTVIFRESQKIVDFRLYDLSWSNLVIRGITERAPEVASNEK